MLKVLEGEQQRWPDALQGVLFAFRTARHKSGVNGPGGLSPEKRSAVILVRDQNYRWVRPDQTYQKLWSGLKILVRMLEVALQPVYRGFT